ncbi:hypothetical protein BaRGS_00023425, partial [Batillaria attramentaria]
TAKEKSTAALDMVRKDLAEFGCTMQKDTGHAVEVTSATLKDSLKAENTSAAKEKVTRGLNAFLEGVSRALTVPPDDDDQIPITSSTAEEMFDRAKARLHAVQVDPGTYMNEPSGSPDAYKKWCEEEFNMEAVKGEISDLLVSKVEVRGLYTKMVPNQVSHVDFWRRYFYKLHQIKLDQARKEALMKRAEKSKSDDSLAWEDDWSGEEEDDGSDWERLPRPGQDAGASPRKSGQQQVTAASTVPKKPTAASTPATPPASSHPGAVSASLPQDSAERAESKQITAAPTSPAGGDSVQGVGAGSVEQRLIAPVEESSGPTASASSPAVVEKAQEGRGGGEKSALESKPSAASGDTTERSPLQESNEKVLAADTMGPPPTTMDSVGADGNAGGDSTVTNISASGSVAEASGGPQLEPESPPVPVAPASGLPPTPAIAVPTVSSPQPLGAGPVASPVPKALAVDVSGHDEEEHVLKTVDKGDIVVVGSDHGSPLSAASDLKAEELAKKLGENINLEDDWESWE